MAAKRRTRTAGVSEAVLEVLRNFENTEVSVDDIMHEAGLTRSQVTGSIAHLRRTRTINSPSKGRYIYAPVDIPTRFDLVKELNGGKVLLQLGHSLWVATKLEI